MSDILITVDEQTLHITDTPKIAAQGVKENNVVFTFSKDWSGFGKVALFYAEDNPGVVYQSVVDSSGRAAIPWEVTNEAGKICIGVTGVKDDVVKTSEILKYKIVKGLYVVDTAPPTPGIYQQMLDIAGSITSSYETISGRLDQIVARNTANLSGWIIEVQTKVVDQQINNDGNIPYITADFTIPENAVLIETSYHAESTMSRFIPWITQNIKTWINGATVTLQVDNFSDAARATMKLVYAYQEPVDMSEVSDLRVGADGITYQSAGGAVREQVNSLQAQIDTLNDGGLIISDEVIAENVTDWLDNHPEATTTVPDESITISKFHPDVIDKTLTENNHPADAKTVGDMFGKVTAPIAAKDLIGKAVSHRGYGWSTVVLPLVCQNTIRAFQIAHDNGYDVIETDVQKDVNGVICCFHDSAVSNVTDQTGYFKEHTRESLYLKDGYGTLTTEIPPTFEEVCQWAAANGVILDVEIKTGSNYNEVSISEVIKIAETVQAKYFINCQNSQDLLDECQTDYPLLWKNTNLYKSQELTNSLIDSLISEGYTNLCLYIQDTNPTTDEQIKYAYDRGIMVTRRVHYYSESGTKLYGMTFSEEGRPNWKGEFIYDSGWIYPDANDFRNGYVNVSGYEVKYRQINGVVYVHGIIKNTTWEVLPTSGATFKSLFTLPVNFTPQTSHRGFGNIGDKFIGFHLIHIPTDGNVIPCYRVLNGVTVEQLNANNYYLFTSFPCVVPKG